MPLLAELHAEIEARVTSMREQHPDWPCARGCDRCCRQLANLPRLTRAEWDLLNEGLAALPPETLSEIRLVVATLGSTPTRPVTCPLLDQVSGACPVYLQRPVACRSYGFYVQRGLGLYCGEIEILAAGSNWADLIWGNQDSVDRRLAGLGEIRSLAEWFGEGVADAKV